MLTPGEQILFTRQRHEAKRMGLHWDYRLVAGDRAYSWATKKEMPEIGKAIVLFEQPVHTSDYALSQRVEIPDGQYGAGVTTLDWVRKARIGENSTPEQLTLYHEGGKYLLKKLDPVKYGDKSWLFKRLDHEASANKYLDKVAQMKPHQDDGLNKLEESGGVILHHSTGSGKTKTFLTAVENAHKDPEAHALVVAPASLITNLDKEIDKHGLKVDKSRLTAMSYEKAVNSADELKKNKYALAVADEAHKLRDGKTKRTQTLREILTGADKRILATATGVYNKPSDIASLVNIAAGEQVLPEDSKTFEKQFLQVKDKPRTLLQYLTGKKPEQVTTLKNEKSLKEVFNKHVSYYDSAEDPKAKDKFPSKTESVIETEMSPEQKRMYSYVEGDMPFMLRMKVRAGLPLDKQEKASLNAFATGVRQASNSHRHLSSSPTAVPYTPKIEKALSQVKAKMESDKNYRGLAYSNYLEAGLDEYSARLKKEGIKHGLYNGSLTREEKDALVKDYNSGKTPLLLISSSGAEGLDLKGTKHVQILEPHFNKSKIRQVVGRAARYESHEHLPEEERKVEVEHYLSTLPKTTFGQATSIDKYLYGMSDEKDEVFDKIKALMKPKASARDSSK